MQSLDDNIPLYLAGWTCWVYSAIVHQPVFREMIILANEPKCWRLRILRLHLISFEARREVQITIRVLPVQQNGRTIAITSLRNWMKCSDYRSVCHWNSNLLIPYVLACDIMKDKYTVERKFSLAKLLCRESAPISGAQHKKPIWRKEGRGRSGASRFVHSPWPRWSASYLNRHFPSSWPGHSLCR